MRLSKSAISFEADLLFVLNLFQEDIGPGMVYEADPTLIDISDTTQLNWEFLPSGIREDVLFDRFLPSDPVKVIRVKTLLQERRKFAQRQLFVFMKPKGPTRKHSFMFE